MSQPRDWLDWTLTDAPDTSSAAHEAATAGAPIPPLRWLTKSKRLWLTFGGVLALVVSLLLVLPGAQQNSTYAIITALIAAEEQAAQQRDVAAFRQFTAEGDSVWHQAQLRLVERGWPAPLPSQGLAPLPAAGQVISIETYAPNILRVAVQRHYAQAAAPPLAFILPQFYRFDGEWRRIPPPDMAWGEQRKYTSPYLNVGYSSTDAPFIEATLPLIEKMLAQVCDYWSCSGLRLNMIFTNFSFRAEADVTELHAHDPLLYALMPVRLSRFPEPLLLLPALNATGYPVDAPSMAFLQRAVQLQVLFAVADQLSFEIGGIGQTGNAFFYALVARMGAHVGLEAPFALEPFQLPREALSSLDRLWRVRSFVWRRPEDMRAALAVLNRLLYNAPIGAEIYLFSTWQNRPSPEAWLAEARPTPPPEAAPDWQTAFEQTVLP